MRPSPLILAAIAAAVQPSAPAAAFRPSPSAPRADASLAQAPRGDADEMPAAPPLLPSSPRRRDLLATTSGAVTASLLPSLPIDPIRRGGPSCNCCRLKRIFEDPSPGPSAANALMETTSPPPEMARAYDRPRNGALDRFFSEAMSTGMDEYEARARPYKDRLFRSLFDSMAETNGGGGSNKVPVVVEVGMGTFPNAPYYAQALRGNADIDGLDIVGVDPNDAMSDYARASAERAGLLSSSSTTSLRNVHGVAEALPFADGSVDAVVGTLTLCSVTDPDRALAEIRRVLRPGTGRFLFWEHVLSEDDPLLALQQRALSPIQTLVADGCHLNRRTGESVRAAFGGTNGGMEVESVRLDGSIIGPTAFGIACA